MSGPDSQSKAPIEEIAEKVAKHEPWSSVAAVAADVLRDDLWRQTHPSASDWLADAASKTKYTVNTFRRQVRLVQFLDEQLGESERLQLRTKEVPFSSLEVLSRLFDVNPDKGKELLPAVLRGSVGFTEVKELYAKTQAENETPLQGRKAFSARLQQFSNWAVSCIERNQEQFIGSVPHRGVTTITSAPRGFPYAKPDVIAVHKYSDSWGNQGMLVDAFEIKLFGSDDAKHVMIRTLEQVSLMSRFFRQTWLIYPKVEPEIEAHLQYVQELAVHLARLELTSVGVVQIPDLQGGDPVHANIEFRALPEPCEPEDGGLFVQFLKASAEERVKLFSMSSGLASLPG